MSSLIDSSLSSSLFLFLPHFSTSKAWLTQSREIKKRSHLQNWLLCGIWVSLMVIHCGILNVFLHFLRNFSISKGDNSAHSPGVVWNFLLQFFKRRCSVVYKMLLFSEASFELSFASSWTTKGCCLTWASAFSKSPPVVMFRNHNLFLNLGLNSFAFLRCGWTGTCPEEKTWAAGLSGVRRVSENPECQIQAHECPERGTASTQPQLIA